MHAAPRGEQDHTVTTRSSATLAALLSAAVLAAGCASGDVGGFPDDGATADVTTEAGDGTVTEAEEDDGNAAAPGTMPDLVGRDGEEAVGELEEQGFQVSTGIVRTTEMEPGLVYRSEPAPGRQIQAGQRITLRIAGEPRE
jgi:hypothetical protein